MNFYSNGGIATTWEQNNTMDNHYGFNWWYWKPAFQWYGKWPLKQQMTTISFSWLCFWWSVTFIPFHLENRDAQLNSPTPTSKE